MNRSFIRTLFQSHQNATAIPSPALICNWLDGLLQLLFPELSDQRFLNEREFEQAFENSRLKLFTILNTFQAHLPVPPTEIEHHFMDSLPHIHASLVSDAQAILKGDPAAVDYTEVVRTYPGFLAIAVFRLAHLFYEMQVPLIPRVLTEDAHARTGIDIHPGATIGERFCIDHGTGVVIGETVEIGNDVKVYQGVTLGALSVRKEMARVKRHPTIQDRVVIYAGATILGGETVIGHDSIIGGNTWITESVPPESRVYYRQTELNQESRPVRK